MGLTAVDIDVPSSRSCQWVGSIGAIYHGRLRAYLAHRPHELRRYRLALGFSFAGWPQLLAQRWLLGPILGSQCRARCHRDADGLGRAENVAIGSVKDGVPALPISTPALAERWQDQCGAGAASRCHFSGLGQRVLFGTPNFYHRLKQKHRICAARTGGPDHLATGIRLGDRRRLAKNPLLARDETGREIASGLQCRAMALL